MNSNHSADHSDPDEGLPPDGDDETRRPSKSAMKRAMHELQDLGEQLLALPDAHLDDIEMPERLREALADWKKTRSHEGRRRQLQFIGKVIRSVDPEPLREAVATFQLGHARNALALHEAERWRADLLADEKSATTRWVEAFPATDVQQLRALVRSARKDAALAPEQRSGRAFRELFQYIKKAMEAQATQDRGSAGGEGA